MCYTSHKNIPKLKNGEWKMKNLKKALGYEYTEKKVFDLKREIVEDGKV